MLVVYSVWAKRRDSEFFTRRTEPFQFPPERNTSPNVLGGEVDTEDYQEPGKRDRNPPGSRVMSADCILRLPSASSTGTPTLRGYAAAGPRRATSRSAVPLHHDPRLQRGLTCTSRSAAAGISRRSRKCWCSFPPPTRRPTSGRSHCAALRMEVSAFQYAKKGCDGVYLLQ